MYLLGQHLLDCSSLGHQTPDLDTLDKVPTLLPVPVLQRLARLHDVVPGAFGGAGKDLPISKVQESPEWFRDRLALLFLRVDASEQGDLNQHARDQKRSLEEFGVDVHVEGKLALSLGLLLFRGENLEPLLVNTLSEQLLDALSGEDFLKGALRLLDQTAPKGAQAKLHDGTVVQDLGGNIGGVDRLLKVRHKQHVTRGVEVVVEGVVVNMAEDCPGPEQGVPRLIEVDA